MADGKIKVAILGGGMGAMSAALGLSEIDPAGEKYDITVHQLGWRLGGKTASGRNPEYGQRIEEHGLHIWSGAYDNAFTLMRLALKALDRPPSHPLATIGDAFKRQNQFILTSDAHDAWAAWPFWFAPDENQNTFPGADSLWDQDPVVPPIETLIYRMIKWIENWVGTHGAGPGHGAAAATMVPVTDLSHQLRPRVASVADHVPTAGATVLLEQARQNAELAKDTPSSEVNWKKVADDLRGAVVVLFCGYLYFQDKPDKLVEKRVCELGVVATLLVIGAIDNDCINKGFHTLDPFDFRDFLLQAAPPLLRKGDNGIGAFLQKTVLMRAFYDYCFAYEKGERDQGRLSACSAVQSLLRLGITYKGAFFFKATAGFGDTIFTPIYQLLKKRGVKFRFFHNVKALLPGADGKTIETIVIEQQAGLAPGVMEYDPLGPPVAGIESWPNAPLWPQLLDGEKLAAAGVNFEDYYGPQPPAAGTLRLQRGQDFDQIVLGIPVGALGTICKALVDQRQDWSDMVSKLATVRTQALQLWSDCAVAELTGTFMGPHSTPETLGPIETGFAPPFDTYSDMSQLLPAEDWPKPGPLSVAYFCGVMADDAAPDNPKLATIQAGKDGLAWMTSQLHSLWSNAGQGGDFDWNLLHAAHPAAGLARYEQQFWRANISPGERYVLSLPGTLQYRLEPGKSGYANLFLAGDWTKVPDCNVGAVEVATMSGLAAASALSGVKIPIVCASTLYGPLVKKEQGLPQYINHSGWMTLPRPPFNANGAEVYSFGFPANHAALQQYLDNTYNVIAGRQRFRVLLDMIFLAYVKNDAIVATTPPFSGQGGVPEVDLGFWLLVGSYEEGHLLPSAIAGVPAYLFVDSGLAVAVGREIMGYPKYVSNITSPAGSPWSGFTASAVVIEKFAPDALASLQQIMSLQGSNVVINPLQNTSLATVPAQVLARMGAAANPELLRPLLEGRYGSLFPCDLNIPFPVWYLKQFRSADGTDAAAYQALLSGPLTLRTMRNMGLITGEWTLELGAFDSLPFITELGLGTPVNGKVTLTTNIGFWASCDYASGTATPLV